ncbi:MAG TPA: mechanosensitive ion channel family protein [Acidimicrobiales bacterium]|nr:mechanosensitive ion channel family protein [Acidimicrobiales bacterium]
MPRKVLRRSPSTMANVWISGGVAAMIAVAAIIVKSEFDHRRGPMHHSYVAWLTVPVVLIAGIYAVGRLADGMGRFLARREIEAAGAVVRLIATGVGYLLVLIAVFELLGVSISHLIIGFGLAGVVLGIAAQQSLGNIFASLVLLFARPFSVGEHIRVRSGTVGVVDAWVLDIGLTYVTLQTEDGLLKVPNSVVLASGIGKLDTPPHRLP